MIIDLAPIREKTGPARLLYMVEGRSKAVFKQWLAGRPKAWSAGIEVVAMDGNTLECSELSQIATERVPQKCDRRKGSDQESACAIRSK